MEKCYGFFCPSKPNEATLQTNIPLMGCTRSAPTIFQFESKKSYQALWGGITKKNGKIWDLETRSEVHGSDNVCLPKRT